MLSSTNPLTNLAALQLSPAERAALLQQGFVVCDRRGGRRYYKLRFRLNGRQHVRYLGTSATAAKTIADELTRFREEPPPDVAAGPHAGEIPRESLVHHERRILRRAKTMLAPHVSELGLHFHGFELRRARKPLVGPLDRPRACKPANIQPTSCTPFRSPTMSMTKSRAAVAHADLAAIEKHRAYIDSSNDPVKVVTGMINSHLLELATLYLPAVKRELTHASEDSDATAGKLPYFVHYLRLTAQIQRFAKLHYFERKTSTLENAVLGEALVQLDEMKSERMLDESGRPDLTAAARTAAPTADPSPAATTAAPPVPATSPQTAPRTAAAKPAANPAAARRSAGPVTSRHRPKSKYPNFDTHFFCNTGPQAPFDPFEDLTPADSEPQISIFPTKPR